MAESSVTLTPTNVKLLAYENSPLYGTLFQREVGNEFSLQSREVSFVAIPMFAATKNSFSSRLSYSWSTSSGDKRVGKISTYRTPDGGRGSSKITLSQSDSKVIIQPLSKSFVIQFSDQNQF